MKRVVFVIGLVMLSAPASAGEPSPWFGSADQPAFQLDTNEQAALSDETDSIQTGARDKAPPLPCSPEGCIIPSDPAMKAAAAGSIPKN
jgi:hypothetical protein